MSKQHKLINYQGNKSNFANKFNDLIQHSTFNTYIEPFVGSGAILFNLEKEFSHYIINDLNENIIAMYNTFREISYSDLLDAKQQILTDFGDIKKSKESYYAFRNDYNEKYHFSNTKEKGLFLYFLANSCINSMLRFGPNGMNQSYGKRSTIMNEQSFIHINKTLQNTEIKNTDYAEVIQPKSVIFLDPPYFERPTSYTENFDKSDLLNFIEKIKSINSDIVYTDIYAEEIQKLLQWDYINSKIITNSSPSKIKDKFQEVAYYNFKLNSTDW